MTLVKLVLLFCGPIGWIAIAILSQHERQCEEEKEKLKATLRAHTTQTKEK